jgi:hypothetical protein
VQTMTDSRAVLRRPALRRFYSAAAISSVGDGMSIVVIAWYAITLAPANQKGPWTGLAVTAFFHPATIGAVTFGRFVHQGVYPQCPRRHH